MGGGIFTILGISVSMVGVFTPIAIIIGRNVGFPGRLFVYQAGRLL